MKNNLNKSQIERFSRQLVLKNVGAAGQKKVLASKIPSSDISIIQ